MDLQSNEDLTMRSYLLGDLDEVQREEVEKRVLCESGFTERLALAQDHLIDDYIFDGLSLNERASFEKNFILNKERRNKIRIAQALEIYAAKDVVAAPAQDRTLGVASGSWRNAIRFLERHKVWAALSFATIILLIFLLPKLAGWLMLRRSAPPVEHRAMVERELAEINRKASPANNDATLELALQPTLLREDGETNKLVITREIEFVKLKLPLPSDSRERYSVIVSTAEGQERFAIPDLQQKEPKSISIIIPSRFLPTNDYQFEVNTNNNGQLLKLALFNLRVINHADK